MRTASRLVLLAGLVSSALSIDLDLSSETSVNNALSSIAFDMVSYYNGNKTGQIPGILPGPCSGDDCYYWWEAGAMWGALINYQQYTGDSSYQSTVLQSLAFQIGPDQNYNPPNQSKNLGLDDQDFWAFAAMEAVEAGVPNSQQEGVPSWLALAEAVFNFQVGLWDNQTCDGGFHWQVYPFNAGYNLKNAQSNGGFFNLAARLARYTGNSTYADWAIKVWNWLEASPLLETNNGTLYVWDNTDTFNNCSDAQHFVWTSNYGQLLMGSAMMYNYTNGSSEWQNRTSTVLDGALSIFFSSQSENVMSEILCEPAGNCNNDQSAFKAFLSRWMAVTSVIAPFTTDKITPALATSAKGAAAQCVGGDNGRKCGRTWYSTTWDGSEGVGQQMSALAVIGATRINSSLAPLRGSESVANNTTSTNGQQTSNNSGTNSSSNNNNSTTGGGSNPTKPSSAAKSFANSVFFTALTSAVVGISMSLLL